jgi:serine/threonine-protein kinase
MAPEQALGERADERSDIYSLGCLLYAMLTGRPPFTGEPAAVIHQHVNAAARPPSQVNPSVWGALDELVIGMLAKSPDARPQSAAEVRDRLHEQSAKTNTPPGTAITQVLGGGTVRRRRLSAVAALVGVILAVLLILALTTGGHPASAGHRGSGASNGTLRRASSRAPLPTRSTTTAGAPHASNTATGAPTVAASAGALTALITQDVGLAAIDQPSAGQITNRLNAILGSYEMGHVTDARRELANLSQQIATLEGQGHITSAAAAPLRAAIASLGSAFGESSAETQTQSGQPPEAPGQDGEGPGQAAEAPGQDGEPPGQAKKHERSHENPEGD